jgi:hypothetical protein
MKIEPGGARVGPAMSAPVESFAHLRHLRKQDRLYRGAPAAYRNAIAELG